jgi:hypothetical protein
MTDLTHTYLTFIYTVLAAFGYVYWRRSWRQA